MSFVVIGGSCIDIFFIRLASVPVPLDIIKVNLKSSLLPLLIFPCLAAIVKVGEVGTLGVNVGNRSL